MNLKKRVIEGGIVAVSLAILTAVTSISGTVVQSTPSTLVQDAKSAEDTSKNVATIESNQVDVVAAADVLGAGFSAEGVAAAEKVTESDDLSVGVGVNAQSMTAIAFAQPEEKNSVSMSVGVNAEAASTVADAQAETTDETDAVTADTKNQAKDAKAEKQQTAEQCLEDKSEKEKKKRNKNADNKEDEWKTRLMPNVDESLNVRASADENAEVVGKLYKGSVAEVKEEGDVWTHIVSGDVDGYVKNQFCMYGKDAKKYAEENFETCATVSTDILRIRSEADEDATILDVAKEGTKLAVQPKEEQDKDGWVKVEYKDGKSGYVSEEFVSVGLDLTQAVTMEQEYARIKEEEEKKAAEEAEKAAQKAAEEAEKVSASADASSSTQPTTTQKAPTSASADDTALLGALIQLEAGGESYEGQVAVGAVVMNRVRSAAYPGSISGVIYQSGQFVTAGGVASLAASGVSASCLQAAQAAINGTDNTGGAVSFRRVSSGCQGLVIGNHVFF